jgi:integrase
MQEGGNAGHDGEEVRRLCSVLDVRERLIARLALLAGMRPGEVFGLKWARLEADYADIQQRVYRGDVDPPKSVRPRSRTLSRGGLRSCSYVRRNRRLLASARRDASRIGMQTGCLDSLLIFTTKRETH